MTNQIITGLGQPKASGGKSMSWSEVKRIRKAMSTGGHLHGKSCLVVGSHYQRAASEIYEAVTGTGRYSHMPQAWANPNIARPVIPGSLIEGLPMGGKMNAIQTNNKPSAAARAIPTKLTVPMPGHMRMLPRHRVESVLAAIVANPGGQDTDWAKASGVSHATVARIATGSAQYEFLRHDPWWQAVQGLMYMHGSSRRKKAIIERGFMPYDADYHAEGDGVVMNAHDGDERVNSGSAMATAVDSLGQWQPPSAGREEALANTMHLKEIVQAVFPEVVAEPEPEPELTPDDEPVMSVGANVLNPTHPLVDAGAPTHERMARDQGELDAAQAATTPATPAYVPEHRLIPVVWNTLDVLGGPDGIDGGLALMGLSRYGGTRELVRKAISDVVDMQGWLKEVEATLRSLDVDGV